MDMCEIMSIADLKDAYHILKLVPDSQKYCGIMPFYDSPTYFYLRLNMGFSVLPAL